MPQAVAPVTEPQLVEGLQPLRGFALATAIQNLFAGGLYDAIAEQPGARVEVLADELGLGRERVEALLTFLANEEVVVIDGGRVELSEKGLRLGGLRAWYEMMIGGYGKTLLDMGDHLLSASPPVPRDGGLVASGSCGISLHDSLPVVRRLLAGSGRTYETFLDLGCGSGVYLTELAGWYPELRAVGIEPSEEAVAAARAWVASVGMEDRIRIELADAVPFLEAGAVRADLVLLGFVLHEILGQRGEDGVRAMLAAVFAANPDADLVIIDIDTGFGDPDRMRHPLAMAYYNSYFLLHPFTEQRLERLGYWEDLFESCGIRIVERLATDPELDSTGFEIGWL
jgi:2-ketoarginine methyltransferase